MINRFITLVGISIFVTVSPVKILINISNESKLGMDEMAQGISELLKAIEVVAKVERVILQV